MLYRKMESTGQELSILGYGCMRFPTIKGKIDEDKAKALLFKAIDNGVNYLDTAPPYHNGQSESFLGKVLTDEYRKKVKIATKLPHWLVKENSDMMKLLDEQLINLKTNCIDYYLIHNIQGDSWDRLKRLEIIRFINKAKRSGKIKFAGFSFHGKRLDFKRIVNEYDWDFCQIQYNFLDTENQAGTEGLEYAASKGLGIVIMEPLRGGKLAGKIPKAVEKVWNKAETKKSPAEWAFKWILNNPNVNVVLSGISEETHLNESLKIFNEAEPDSFSNNDLELVKNAAEAYRSLMKAPCTGCQYCMPCPFGVNIPNALDCYNNKYLFNSKTNSQMFYFMINSDMLTGKNSLASQCTNCEKCLKKCPQHLPIPDLMKQVKKEFESFRSKILLKGIKLFMKIIRRKSKRKA